MDTHADTLLPSASTLNALAVKGAAALQDGVLVHHLSLALKGSGSESEKGSAAAGSEGNTDASGGESESTAAGKAESKEGKATEGKATEGKATEGKAVEGKAVEGKAVEGKAVEGKAVEGKAVEGKAVEGKAAEGKAVEGKAAETNSESGSVSEGSAGPKDPENKLCDIENKGVAKRTSVCKNTATECEAVVKLDNKLSCQQWCEGAGLASDGAWSVITWSSHAWTDFEKASIKDGDADDDTCKAGGNIFTNGTNGKYPGCGDGVCCTAGSKASCAVRGKKTGMDWTNTTASVCRCTRKAEDTVTTTAAPKVVNWFLSRKGKSCDVTCAAKNKTCDSTKQSTLTNKAAVKAAMAQAGHKCKGFHEARDFAGTPFSTGRNNSDCAPIQAGVASSCFGNDNANNSALCYCAETNATLDPANKMCDVKNNDTTSVRQTVCKSTPDECEAVVKLTPNVTSCQTWCEGAGLTSNGAWHNSGGNGCTKKGETDKNKADQADNICRCVKAPPGGDPKNKMCDRTNKFVNNPMYICNSTASACEAVVQLGKKLSCTQWCEGMEHPKGLTSDGAWEDSEGDKPWYDVDKAKACVRVKATDKSKAGAQRDICRCIVKPQVEDYFSKVGTGRCVDGEGIEPIQYLESATADVQVRRAGSESIAVAIASGSESGSESSGSTKSKRKPKTHTLDSCMSACKEMGSSCSGLTFTPKAPTTVRPAQMWTDAEDLGVLEGTCALYLCGGRDGWWPATKGKGALGTVKGGTNPEEVPDAKSGKWVKGANGKSCDAVCEASGGACDSDKQSVLTTTAVVKDAFTQAGYTCKGFHGARDYPGAPFSTGKNGSDCAPIKTGAKSSCATNNGGNLSALCFCRNPVSAEDKEGGGRCYAHNHGGSKCEAPGVVADYSHKVSCIGRGASFMGFLGPQGEGVLRKVKIPAGCGGAGDVAEKKLAALSECAATGSKACGDLPGCEGFSVSRPGTGNGIRLYRHPMNPLQCRQADTTAYVKVEPAEPAGKRFKGLFISLPPFEANLAKGTGVSLVREGMRYPIFDWKHCPEGKQGAKKVVMVREYNSINATDELDSSGLSLEDFSRTIVAKFPECSGGFDGAFVVRPGAQLAAKDGVYLMKEGALLPVPADRAHDCPRALKNPIRVSAAKWKKISEEISKVAGAAGLHPECFSKHESLFVTVSSDSPPDVKDVFLVKHAMRYAVGSWDACPAARAGEGAAAPVKKISPRALAKLPLAAGGLAGAYVECWRMPTVAVAGKAAGDSHTPASCAKAHAGGSGACAITKRGGGSLKAWGRLQNGGVGDCLAGATAAKGACVRGVEGVLSVSASKSAGGAAATHHAFAVTDGGALWAWGANTDGQLGDGMPTGDAEGAGADEKLEQQLSNAMPHQVLTNDPRGTGVSAAIATPRPAAIVQATAGAGCGMAVDAAGALWVWGSTANGQLGIGAVPNGTDVVRAPRRVVFPGGNTSDVKVTRVESRGGMSFALRSDGSLWRWGKRGLCATATTVVAPKRVTLPRKAISVALGNHHVVVLLDNNRVYTAGSNVYGELGQGGVAVKAGGNKTQEGPCSAYPKFRPVPLAFRDGSAMVVESIAASSGASFAVTKNGKVFAWGRNHHGELGSGKKLNSTVAEPQEVVFEGEGGKEVAAIEAGEHHVVVLMKDGAVWGWGHNTEGQVGPIGSDGITTQATPRRMVAPGSAAKVAAGAAVTFVAMRAQPDGDSAEAMECTWNEAACRVAADMRRRDASRWRWTCKFERKVWHWQEHSLAINGQNFGSKAYEGAKFEAFVGNVPCAKTVWKSDKRLDCILPRQQVALTAGSQSRRVWVRVSGQESFNPLAPKAITGKKQPATVFHYVRMDRRDIKEHSLATIDVTDGGVWKGTMAQCMMRCDAYEPCVAFTRKRGVSDKVKSECRVKAASDVAGSCSRDEGMVSFIREDVTNRGLECGEGPADVAFDPLITHVTPSQMVQPKAAEKGKGKKVTVTIHGFNFGLKGTKVAQKGVRAFLAPVNVDAGLLPEYECDKTTRISEKAVECEVLLDRFLLPKTPAAKKGATLVPFVLVAGRWATTPDVKTRDFDWMRAPDASAPADLATKRAGNFERRTQVNYLPNKQQCEAGNKYACD